GLALLLGNALLQEVEIGRDLNLDEIRRLDYFAELAEVYTIGIVTVGHENFPVRMWRQKKTRQCPQCARRRLERAKEQTKTEKARDRPRRGTACPDGLRSCVTELAKRRRVT